MIDQETCAQQELAAVAAGYKLVWDRGQECFRHRETGLPWRPEVDSEDAAQLALDCMIQIQADEQNAELYISFLVAGEPQITSITINAMNSTTPDDVLAAIRYTILDAAAQIGRALKAAN